MADNNTEEQELKEEFLPYEENQEDETIITANTIV